MTEYEKMVAGQIYDACDAELLKELNAVKVLCQQYNNLLPTDFAARNEMLRQLLGQATNISSGTKCRLQDGVTAKKKALLAAWATLAFSAYRADRWRL